MKATYNQTLKDFKGIAIVGPTSSGKTELAVKIARRLKAEIISVDSRQVYKGLDLLSGKATPLRKIDAKSDPVLYKNIIHYGLNIKDPKSPISAASFKKYADKRILQIQKKGKLPILCGGSMHWLDAIIYEQNFPEVKPNTRLRNKLEKFSTEKLFEKLVKLDPNRASIIDRNNRRRLIRALEIIHETKAPIAPLMTKKSSEWLLIGIHPEAKLEHKILSRLKKRIRDGMIDEIKRLRNKGMGWKKIETFGLEMKFGALYLQKKINRNEMLDLLYRAILQYTKRQMTWWKRNRDIIWFNDAKEVLKFIRSIN